MAAPAAGERAYTPPAWGTAPSAPWRLDVLRDGVQLPESVQLGGGRDHHIVGKRPDICDIVLGHESISRSHAALQFGEGGELYVIDLGSTHGTRLNKQPVAPRRYTLAPVGSVLQFGASTRLYVVEGPPAFAPPEAAEPAALERARAQSEERQLRKAQERLGGSGGGGGGGASWGQAEDAVDDGGAFQPGHAADDDDGSCGDGASCRAVVARLGWIERLDLAALGERERGLFDKLHRTLLRLRHLSTECERIRAKAVVARRGGGSARECGRGGSSAHGRKEGDDDEGDGGGGSSGVGEDGLSEGQAAQLVRNEEALERALESVGDEEAAFKARLLAKGHALPKGVPAPGGAGGLTAGGGGREAALLLPEPGEDDVQDHSAASRERGGGGGGLGAGRVFVLRKRAVGGGGAGDDEAPRVATTASTSSVTASAPPLLPAAALRAQSRLPPPPGGAAAAGAATGRVDPLAVLTYAGLCAQLADVERALVLLQDEEENAALLRGATTAPAAAGSRNPSATIAGAHASGGGGSAPPPLGRDDPAGGDQCDGVAAAAAAARSGGGSGGDEEQGDALDDYMRATAQVLASAEQAARAARLAELRSEQSRLAKLAALVKPALAEDALRGAAAAQPGQQSVLVALAPLTAVEGGTPDLSAVASSSSLPPATLRVGAAGREGGAHADGHEGGVARHGDARGHHDAVPPSILVAHRKEERGGLDSLAQLEEGGGHGGVAVTAVAAAASTAAAVTVPQRGTGGKRVLGPSLPPPRQGDGAAVAGEKAGDEELADGASGAAAAAGAHAGQGGGDAKRARLAAAAHAPPPLPPSASSLAPALARAQQRRQLGPGQPQRATAGAVISAQHSVGEDLAAWRPPAGQTGDGRTALNDQLGY